MALRFHYTINDFELVYYDNYTATGSKLTPTTAAILALQEKLTIVFGDIGMTAVLVKDIIEGLLPDGSTSERRKRA
ncbi:unnamed protein product, partial [Didymodactylos carnosus]